MNVQCVLSGDVWRPVECGTTGTEVALLLPAACGKERGEESSVLSLSGRSF
jgi:hypothetical protein